MNLKGFTNSKLIVVLRKKKHVRYLMLSKLVNRIGSSLYNLALLTLASKQTYSTLAISLVNLLGNIPSLIDPILAYLTDRETKRLKKATLLNTIQVVTYVMITFLMLKYQMPLAIFVLILLANVLSDSLDGYISNMFAPFSKTWIAQDERRSLASLDIVLFSLSVVVGQLLGAGWLVLFPDQFFSLSLINALTFTLSLFFLKKIKFNDSVKMTESAKKQISVRDFFKKMNSAYTHMRKRHVLQTIWILAFCKAEYASYILLLNVAMVSVNNLRFGSYSQTLVVLQIVTFVGLILGSFFRINWLEKISYGQLNMLVSGTVIIMTICSLYELPLIFILIFKLIGTFLSGYIAPKYYADLIQSIDEEQLTRVESLNGFILMLSAPLGALQATFCLHFFNLKTSWLLELVALVLFTMITELMFYRKKVSSQKQLFK